MKTSQLFFVGLLVLSPNFVFAQKDETADTSESYGIFQTQDEYHEFMGTVKRQGLNDPELMAMVPMINDIVLGKPIGSTSQRYRTPASSSLGLLANPDVRKDLEMVEQQYKDLQRSNTEIQQRAAEQMRSIDFSDVKSATDRIREIREQSEKELQATLLPHQMERLHQIAAQSQLRRRSLIDVITSDPLKTRLKINDVQSDELKTAEKEIEKDLEEQIAKLREQARKRLLSKLKLGQRKQVEEIFGDIFEFGQDDDKKNAGSK